MKILLLILFCLSAFSATFMERDDSGRIINRTAGVVVDDNFRIRYVGTHDITANSGQTVTADWEIPAMNYGGSPAKTSFNGVRFKVVGGNDGDNVTLQVVDADYQYAGVLYPAEPAPGVTWATAAPDGVLLDEFGTNYFVFPDEISTIKEHKADLPNGLEIRVRYVNTGGSNARFIMNMNRMIEVE